MRKALPILSILLLATPACAPFAGGRPTVTASDAGCSGLIPQDWEQGVPPAEIPAGDTVGDWIAFGDAQTGKLDQANGRTKDVIGITKRCEERDRRAVKRAGRGFFGRLFSDAGERKAILGERPSWYRTRKSAAR